MTRAERLVAEWGGRVLDGSWMAPPGRGCRDAVGTVAGHRRHISAYDAPCDACRAAEAERKRKAREAETPTQRETRLAKGRERMAQLRAAA